MRLLRCRLSRCWPSPAPHAPGARVLHSIGLGLTLASSPALAARTIGSSMSTASQTGASRLGCRLRRFRVRRRRAGREEVRDRWRAAQDRTGRHVRRLVGGIEQARSQGIGRDGEIGVSMDSRGACRDRAVHRHRDGIRLWRDCGCPDREFGNRHRFRPQHADENGPRRFLPRRLDGDRLGDRSRRRGSAG